jgi:hypothetical protein
LASSRGGLGSSSSSSSAAAAAPFTFEHEEDFVKVVVLLRFRSEGGVAEQRRWAQALKHTVRLLPGAIFGNDSTAFGGCGLVGDLHGPPPPQLASGITSSSNGNGNSNYSGDVLSPRQAPLPDTAGNTANRMGSGTGLGSPTAPVKASKHMLFAPLEVSKHGSS